MWIHKVVLEACPICSKETTLAGGGTASDSSRNGAPYISMPGLRTGQNQVNSFTVG